MPPLPPFPHTVPVFRYPPSVRSSHRTACRPYRSWFPRRSYTREQKGSCPDAPPPRVPRPHRSLPRRAESRKTDACPQAVSHPQSPRGFREAPLNPGTPLSQSSAAGLQKSQSHPFVPLCEEPPPLLPTSPCCRPPPAPAVHHPAGCQAVRGSCCKKTSACGSCTMSLPRIPPLPLLRPHRSPRRRRQMSVLPEMHPTVERMLWYRLHIRCSHIHLTVLS